MRALVTFPLVVLLLTAPGVSGGVEISTFPKTVSQGQVSLVRIRTKNLSHDAFTLLDDKKDIPLLVCSHGKEPALCGFIAHALDAPVGGHQVSIEWEENGTQKTRPLSIVVKKGTYRVSQLKVSPDLLDLSPAEKKRIEEEREDTRAAYASSEEEPLWTGRFQLPTKGAVTSRFGNRRIFNGELKSVHSGVDLRASTKTRIHSANAGKVVLAKSLFYAGNQVIVDHGAGIFSSYGHLSAMSVKPGDKVAKGQKLGLAGATGRATGPHLHWGMRVHGLAVDPIQLREIINLFESKVSHDELPSFTKSGSNQRRVFGNRRRGRA